LRDLTLIVAIGLQDGLAAPQYPVIIFGDGSYLIEPSNDELGAKAGIAKR